MTKQAYEYNVFDTQTYEDPDLPNAIMVVDRYERNEGQETDYNNPETHARAYVEFDIPSSEWDPDWWDLYYYDTDPDLPWFVPLLDFDKGN